MVNLMNLVPSGTFESTNLGLGTVFGEPDVQSGMSPHSNEMENSPANAGAASAIARTIIKTNFFILNLLLSHFILLIRA